MHTEEPHKVEIGSSTVDLGNEGVLFESDFRAPDDPYFISNIERRQFAMKDYACEDEEAQRALEAFKSTYNDFESALYSHDWYRVCQLIDVDSFVNYFVLTEFTYNPDGGGTSFYFYKDSYNDVIHMGPPGDYDDAYCSRHFEDAGKYQDVFRTHYNNSQLSSLMMSFIEFRKLCEDKYKHKLMNCKDLIVNRIDSTYSRIHVDASTNNNYGNVGSFTSGVNHLKSFVDSRYEYLDLIYGNRASFSDGLYDVSSYDKTYNHTIYIKNTDDGYVEIVDPSTNLALDVLGNSPYVNSATQFIARNNIDAQKGLICKHNWGFGSLCGRSLA